VHATTSASAEPSQTASTDVARAAGRGGVAVLGAKVFFLVVGFVQQPLLRLAVGLSDFGGLAQAMVVANVVNNVVISSGTQGVSRIVAGAPGREDEALRSALKVHVPLAIAVAAVMAAAAPLYARFERAEDVVAPLLVLAGVALLYGVYAPLIGYLNGRGRFGRQALLDVTFGTLRTFGLVGVGYAFAARGLSGVLGTTLGWVAAAGCIVPLAARSTGLGAPVREDAARAAPAARAYLLMLLPIAGAQLCTNLLLQVDLGLIGHFLGESAAAAAPMTDGSASRDAVKAWVAVYRECQTFAFLPYQLLFSVTLILFPMLARARAESDDAAVKAYVARGSRVAAVFGGLLVAVVVALPESLLAFAYGADAAKGASVLRVMALGQGAFAMLGIATTVLTSLGHELRAAAITLLGLAAVTAACFGLVPGAAFGHAQLVRSAMATGIALGGALVVAAVVVLRRAGAFVPAWTGVRVGLALAVCYGAGHFIPRVSRVLTPVAALVVAAGYCAVLVVTGEVGREDLAMVRALRSKRAVAPSG
jgi:stage V sporulation protein B